MTRLANSERQFASEMIDGFVAAHRRWVVKAPGGVVRARRTLAPTVGVLIGGGSGHYPAFAGLVGHGLAHGAAMGNIFASPSASQIQVIAKTIERGRGVFMSFGNYAGDVLHFGEAQNALRGEGIDCRTVVVTDDIFSAPASERHRRRGIAGDLTVFKIAGAAAETGWSLDEVERVAILANERTRSMGVAFGGCTLPGAAAPLFAVPPGKMAIGMGIHGEPGILDVPLPSADALAALFITRLLEEIPEGLEAKGARVVPILNGLGAVKYEEMFVLYRKIDELLGAAGIEVVDPQVGEFCTSFDMAGVSLTLFWLNDELEALWNVPADTPAFRAGVAPSMATEAAVIAEGTVAVIGTVATEESRAAAASALRALQAMRSVIDRHAEDLGRIDAIAGDGDHGIGMQRGLAAAVDAANTAANRGAGVGSLLRAAADAWADQAGGASGAIWGVILRSIGNRLGDAQVPNAAAVSEGVAAAVAQVQAFGKAKVGDKTMVDALVPFSESLAEMVGVGSGTVPAWQAAAAVATQAATATADLVPQLGRARTHGKKSLGTVDPGALSLALIAVAVGEALGAQAQ